MMSKLTQLHDEATRLLTIYEEHKDNPDEFLCRGAHIQLDRFLMENRETAIILIVKGLQAEIDALTAEIKAAQTPKRPWLHRVLRRKGGVVHGGTTTDA